MNLSEFIVEPDLRGRRLRVHWRIDFAQGEVPGAMPAMRLARKTLDYEFPTPDVFIIYDSTAFPPAGTVLATLASTDTAANGGRVSREVESISNAGVEAMRRTIQITTAADGSPSSWSIDLLDASGLDPLTTYYYELRLDARPGLTLTAATRASATTTDRYELGARMYSQLPEIYRRHDVVAAQLPPAWAALPEADSSSGQLYRFLDLMGSTGDYLRSRAEGMLDLHDFRSADSRLLPLMASWIGWDLDFAASIPEQRHEIRYASALYRMTGTIPGCMIWVRRLSGWNGRIKEFGRNVFFSNDLGNPSDPTDKGSLTVDTSNATLVANIKTYDDDVDYTYDTGTDLDSWYSYNTVGIFLKPADGATADDANTRAGRLQSNVTLFLPVNVRGVVILDVPKTSSPLSESVGMLNTEDQ